MKPPLTAILRVLTIASAALTIAPAATTQPPSPADPSPINGETYYLINQLSGLQADLNPGPAANGDNLLQNPRSFSMLTQRWAMTRTVNGAWKISNISSGMCMDSASSQGVVWAVQNPCGSAVPSQEWTLTYTTNGYNIITNAGTHLVLDVSSSSRSAGARLTQSLLSGPPSQSQLWMFRPVYFRGNDMSTASKEEFARVAHGVTWWHDAYLPGQDILQIFKNHGMNMIRLRPASINTTVVHGKVSFPLTFAPYNNYTLGAPPATQIIPTSSNSSAPGGTSSGNHAQTDWSAIDLAKRAKNLGMSVNVTLFYSGDNTAETPGNWAGKTLAQIAGVPPNAGLMYNYVKQEMELFRANGVMPDLVAIGNEVNTGMFTTTGANGLSGATCSPTGSGGGSCFVQIQQAAMQAIVDAASDTSDPALGPPLPPPLRCIHTDGGPDLQTFFQGATQTNAIPIDAICQSYYPGWHGPMTQAQQNWHRCASATCTSTQRMEAANLNTQAAGLGLPVFTIEDGVQYTTGGSPSDVWYGTPAPSRARQRQYTIDLNKVQKSMANNLSLGMEYWAGEATPIPGVTALEGFWTNGPLGLFDNSTTAGSPLNNAVLPVMDALGGRLDPTLTYKFVNAVDGRILETDGASTAGGAALRTALDSGVTGPQQQWQILAQGADPEQNAAVYPAPMDHLGDGYFQIVNGNQASGLHVLDSNGLTTDGSPVVQNDQGAAVTAISGTVASQEWDILSVGNCGDISANCTAPPLTAAGAYYMIVNKATGLVLAASGTGAASTIQQQTPATPSNGNWMVPANKGQLWQIVPVHITAAPALAPAISATLLAPPPVFGRTDRVPNALATVTIRNNGGSTINGPFHVVFPSLTHGVEVLNATDTFGGRPYVTIGGLVSLAPGESAKVAVKFSRPSPLGTGFKPVVYTGGL